MAPELEEASSARMTDPEPRPAKRASIPLTRACAVCGSPAPEHLHFGGESENNRTRKLHLDFT